MSPIPELIRFDRVMKRLLRDKANFEVLEGLLTTLLGREIKIDTILESESNRDDAEMKYNRVDMIAQSTEGELIGIRKVAKNLLEAGMEVAQVVQATGLTEEDLRDL